ncbi:chitin-binding protein [Thermosporothrix hazakensis]|jgi:chitin-binding protein|uniref:Chitin-binding protein n=2 Tax=Thermosporothrix TaxID=768650 RepID=A0A326U967_THEHA|nr:lytic polysaccharide monooxygenase [Thermosporothrix hazakensis]PZW32736.1 chitin-binding protein [Thermosporothrix hazakensis]BBH87651.1 chitin-binding protein [Thermosporothrix sp. COM3]GCE50094.1 chitin-binding protein [Thermosporothrix hazakensis]
MFPHSKQTRWAVLGLVLAALIVPALLAAFLPTQIVKAHGAMTSPATRTYFCYLEGPEDPDSPACQDAVAIGGTQPLYDWFAILISNAAGRHREIIPDGHLCSAGTTKYAAYDAARTDWPSTTLQSGVIHTFKYAAWAPHPGTFELYVTRDGYDPTQPLKWSDLEPLPFNTVTNPPIVDGAYQWQAQLPANKSGRHIIYSIWQRSDSPEAFYNCSDVVFTGGGTPTTPTPTPTQTPLTCKATVKIDNAWQGGFQATISVTNTSSRSVAPWEIGWTMQTGTSVTNGWNATVTQSGSQVTAKAPDWNRSIAAGGSASVSFVANGSSNPPPSSVTLNGTACS